MQLSSSEIKALKQSVVEGEVEPVLTALLAKLEHESSEWGDLAQAIRIIQADYLQVKSQVIRGTISSDNARLAYNQINANILDVLKRIESGKKSLTDPVTPPSQAWRYYVAGGVVTLALAFVAWKFLGQSQKGECPVYGKNIAERIMLLPFKKGSTGKDFTPEIDISDGLNDLIRKDQLLNKTAESDVYESYDIEKNYPNPSEATEIASGCGVEMIVWGKVRNGKDTVEVRYKLLNPAVKAPQSTDANLNKLLEFVDEGVWVDNITTISKMLYLVIANQKGDKQMAMAIFNDINKTALVSASADSSDTTRLAAGEISKLLNFADVMRTNGMKKEALSVYDEILASYPDNEQALQRRGALNFSDNKFWAAARDLQNVEPDPTKAPPDILRIRVDAYLKCGWPDKARQDLEQYKKLDAASKDAVWIKQREISITDSLKVYNQRLEATKLVARKKPNDDQAQLALAQAHTALGEPDKAIAIAETVHKRKPRNVEAMKTVIEASAQKGDIKKVNETVREAERTGVSTKSFKFFSPTIRALETQQVPKEQ
jgi:tetratricopeptide (TPR) repeat protein